MWVLIISIFGWAQSHLEEKIISQLLLQWGVTNFCAVSYGGKNNNKKQVLLRHILGTFRTRWLSCTPLPFLQPFLFFCCMEQDASLDQDKGQQLWGWCRELFWKEFGSLTMSCTVPALALPGFQCYLVGILIDTSPTFIRCLSWQNYSFL